MTQMRNRRHIAAKWNTILCKDVDAKINALVDKSTSWQARRTIYGKCSPHRILLLTYERVLVCVGNGIYWAPLVFMPMLSYLISCMVRMDTWTTSIIPQIICNHMLNQLSHSCILHLTPMGIYLHIQNIKHNAEDQRDSGYNQGAKNN